MTRPTDGKQIIPVYVIVPPRLLLLDVAGPLEVLRKANLDQDKVEFAVHYVGPLGTVHSSIGLAVTGVDPVPLGGPVASRDEDAVFEHEIISWLKRVVCPGVRLVTICSGALLAARAGLLDGYVCTTHHLAIAELEKSAPTAKVLQNRLFVEDGERLTSAGITAGIDLMLQIVADIIGHGVALSVARYLVVYLRRSGGDPQLSPWLEGRNHMNPVVHRAQDAIAADPAGAWPVEKLADVSGASPRNLSRLFNEHAGMSVTDYVNRLKVGLAREMLLNSGLDIENVAERSGFASARQFRRAWQRIYDQPPSHARGAVG
jgi:transcriptional regulator GlxA family with amidase domain